VQVDLKKLVAYSSVSHLGFVMLGIFALNPYGIQGALIQNINHGISTGALFLLVGIIYDRRHTRLIKQFGGLAKIMPKYAICFMIVALSSIGLPGMNGFVGEFLILLGIFQVNGLWAACATSGVILAACYILWMFQRVMFLEVKNPKNMNLKDMNVREMFTVVPLIILIFWIGLYPKPFMDTFDASVTHLVSKVNPDNFRPKQEHHNNDHNDKQNEKHGEHALLITPTEMASLNHTLQMPVLIKE
jgi:NADH-quinone oxidoreductase subunit M